MATGRIITERRKSKFNHNWIKAAKGHFCSKCKVVREYRSGPRHTVFIINGTEQSINPDCK